VTHADGMLKLLNIQSVVLAIGPSDIAYRGQQHKVTFSFCPFLYLLCLSENTACAWAGFAVLKRLVHQLLGVDFELDMCVQDQSKGLLAGTKHVFPNVTLLGCYPHTKRAPDELKAWKAATAHDPGYRQQIKKDIDLLSNCRFDSQYSGLLRRMVAEWENCRHTPFSRLFQAKHDLSSESPFRIHYGAAKDVLGVLPNNNPIEGHFGLLQGQRSANELAYVQKGQTINHFLHHGIDSILSFDAHQR
jgi:hypothetical protein